MIIAEQYKKSKIDNKIYDTVILTDIVELKNEKYLILSGYMFNKKDSSENISLNENYKKDTFFRRDITDEKSDIDAYYLIYNIDRNEIINEKKRFIEENDLNKNIRLDRTKCEEIQISDEVAYKIKAKKSEYVFFDVKNEIPTYLLFKNTKHGLYPEHLIKFNDSYNTVMMDNDIAELQNMANELQNKNIFRMMKDSAKLIKNITLENERIEETN